jgi:hypothetical protein
LYVKVSDVLQEAGVGVRFEKAADVVNMPYFVIRGATLEEGKYGSQIVFLCESEGYRFKLSLSPSAEREALLKYYSQPMPKPLGKVRLIKVARSYHIVDAPDVEAVQLTLPTMGEGGIRGG